MVNFTKLQILQQSGTWMLAQANQAPQSVLSLLRQVDTVRCRAASSRSGRRAVDHPS